MLALAPNDAWAVGFSTPVAPPKQAATLTLIEHFDGTSWAVVPSPNVGRIARISSEPFAWLDEEFSQRHLGVWFLLRGRRIGAPDDTAIALGRDQLDSRIQSQPNEGRTSL